jgi:serine/threonine protein kinase
MEDLSSGVSAEEFFKVKRDWETVTKPILKQVLSTVVYLHEVKKICHRDLHPGNIIISPQGEVKLIDFNVSKSYGKGSEGHLLRTSTGRLPYKAPEMYK